MATILFTCLVAGTNFEAVGAAHAVRDGVTLEGGVF